MLCCDVVCDLDDIREIRELRISVANELKESEEESEMLADAKLRPVDQDHHEDGDDQHEDDDDQHENGEDEIQNMCFLKA